MVGPTTVAQAVRLCIFDTRKGAQEGYESEKILFFFPEYINLPEQLSLVGLSEGLIAFTRMFSPHAPCETMDAEKHRHIFYECEPNIWMILVLEKGGPAGLEEELRDEAIRAVLLEIHSLFRLFHGPIEELLAAESPSSNAVKHYLQLFLSEFFSGGGTGKKWKIPSMADSLTERGTVQQYKMESQTCLVVQGLVALLEQQHRLDMTGFEGSASPIDCMFLFHNCLLTSTLTPQDTSTLYRYSLMRLLPATHPPHSLVYSKITQVSATDAVMATKTASSIQTTHSKIRSLFRNPSSSSTISNRLNEATNFLPNSSQISRKHKRTCFSDALKSDAWYRHSDGFIRSTIAFSSAAGLSSATPEVYLLSGEWRDLKVFSHKSLTVIMAVKKCRDDGGRESDVTANIVEKMRTRLVSLEQVLAQEWLGPVAANHIQGHRYLHIHREAKVTQASPSIKVATLSKDSIGLLNQVRAEIDEDRKFLSAAADQSSASNKSTSNLEVTGNSVVYSLTGDTEICALGHNRAWVMVRKQGQQELYSAMERAADTLVLASESMERINNRYFEGAFSSQ